MASFDDIFGKKSGGSSFLKFTEDKETFLVQQTGEPEARDQKNAKGQVVYLVKMKSAPKYKPMGADEFDQDSENVENFFKPDPNYVVPVRIIGHKNAKGESAEDQVGSDVIWDTSAGDTFAKLKDAVLEEGVGLEVGAVYAVKRLDSKSKPYTYSVKVVKTADQVADEK